MKRFLPFVFLAASFGASAQATFGHFDQLKLQAATSVQGTKAPSAQGAPQVTVLMKVADDATVERLKAAGAEVQQTYGSIVVAHVEAARAEAVAATEGVVSVSLDRELNVTEWTSPLGIDLSRQTLGLDKMHSGAAPLTSPYTGEGVVVGVVDTGLDAQHAAFLDEDGNLRVKRIYFTLSSGQQVTLDTPQRVSVWKGDKNTATHGTHVTGIAAGSNIGAPGTDVPYLTGAAPDADIYLAGTEGNLKNEFMLASVKSIQDEAAKQGKPCVINLSLGNNGGPLDGTDEASQALSALAKEGKAVICVASGNEGDANATLHATFPESGKVGTFIEPSLYTEYLWPSQIGFYARAFGNFEVWGEDDTPVKVTFSLVKKADPTQVVASITVGDTDPAYLSVPDAVLSIGVNSKYIVTDNTAFNGLMFGSFMGGKPSVAEQNNRYRVECRCLLQFLSQQADDDHAVMLSLEGTPGKQVFVYTSTYNGLFPMNFSSRGLDGYLHPDGDGTLNSIACAQNVLTVGSYNTHRFTSQGTGAGFEIGQTSYFSSWAKLADGRHLPHICAPGMNIVSAMSRHYADGVYYSEAEQPKYYTITKDGKGHSWTPMTGTSMATPYMTGVAATWLSADPSLTTDDIIRIAQETAVQPEDATDAKGASGNLDAFAGLCKVLNLSGIGNVAVDKADAITIVPGAEGYRILAPGADHIDITIHDMSGRTVSMFTTADNPATVATGHLTPGIYLITASTPNGTRTVKINR